ncbi:MAG TPA: VOC family protein [Methylomirabilota bacterium]|jgi:catechol 2,3-dioxygenase|nr:VOC family protein [Methylomirabilota bacterium]
MSSGDRGSPANAQPPVGINHVVLNVRDIEVSHRFWTEIMGFRQVAQLRPKPGRPPMKMRFYSGVREGAVTHHDLALMEVPASAAPGSDPEPWSLTATRVGVNHLAIAWPDRDSWLRQIAFLRDKGVHFHLRINHGMTHSAYISDPDGYGIEVLYELPRDVWEADIDAAQNYSERLPTDGEEAMIDRTDNPVFGRA